MGKSGWLGREISDNHDTILNIINLPRDWGLIQQCDSGCIVKLNISNAGDVTGRDTFYRSDQARTIGPVIDVMIIN